MIHLLPQSTEFWSAFLGAILGAMSAIVASMISTKADRDRWRAEKEHAWNQVRDQDLRLFQEAIIAAVDSLEYEIGYVYQQGLDSIVKEKWLPIQSHAAVAKARMLATRVHQKSVKEKWIPTDSLIRDAMIALQVAIWTRDSNHPAVAGMDLEDQSKVFELTGVALNHAFEKATKVRVSLDALTSCIEGTFEEYRRS